MEQATSRRRKSKGWESLTSNLSEDSESDADSGVTEHVEVTTKTTSAKAKGGGAKTQRAQSRTAKQRRNLRSKKKKKRSPTTSPPLAPKPSVRFRCTFRSCANSVENLGIECCY